MEPGSFPTLCFPARCAPSDVAPGQREGHFAKEGHTAQHRFCASFVPSMHRIAFASGNLGCSAPSLGWRGWSNLSGCSTPFIFKIWAPLTSIPKSISQLNCVLLPSPSHANKGACAVPHFFGNYPPKKRHFSSPCSPPAFRWAQHKLQAQHRPRAAGAGAEAC